MTTIEIIEKPENTEDWENKIGIICRQTSYTKEEAHAQLELHKGDVEKVLCVFVEAPVQENASDNDKIKSSVNQEIFKQIREVMDDASRKYRISKGLEEMEINRQKQNTTSNPAKEKND